MDRNAKRKEERQRLKRERPEEHAELLKRENVQKRASYYRCRAKDPEKFRKKDREAAKRRYADPNKREIILEGVRDRARKRKQWFQKLKTKLKCHECGVDHPAALVFHHRDGKDKDAPISTMVNHQNRAKDVVLVEMKKCAVLCSNCHAVFHHKYGMTGFPKYRKGMIMKNGQY